jgi:hypothetical protein
VDIVIGMYKERIQKRYGTNVKCTKTKKNNKISYKREEYRENKSIRTMVIKSISKRTYEYSKATQKVTISKKTNIHNNKNKPKPVTNIASLKYCSNNNIHVNSKVLCTWWRSTQTGEYTWQLCKNGTERGYIGVCTVISVCKKNAPNKVAYVRNYSKSDITEMAENNGQMDVDPDGLRMYSPYGKPIVNLCTSVIHMCKTLMRYSNPKTAVSKYGDCRDVKVRVRIKMHSYVKIDVSTVCVYPEAVVTNTWSARSKTVTIQSSSWHKEYGE